MSQDISDRLKRLAEQSVKSPQLIMKIEGLDFLFGTSHVLKIARFGDEIYFGDEGLVFGGGVIDPNSRNYISKEGTTSTITQQLAQDKGAVASASSFSVALVDFNGEVSRIFKSGEYFDDFLGRLVDVYINFVGGTHPDDSLRIYTGIIDSISPTAGKFLINISSSEQLKRQEIIPEYSTELSSSIDSSQTTIAVVDASGFVESQDIVGLMIRVGDEIISIGGISGNNLTGCTRGAMATQAVSHDDEEECQAVYSLEEEALTLALKILLSGSGYFASADAARFNVTTPTTYKQNAIQFDLINVEYEYGIVVGDLITSTGATNSANNFVGRLITEIGTNEFGSYVVVDGASLVDEIESGASVTFKSKYDTLPTGFGCSMTPRQVDVERHEFYLDSFSGYFHNYLFYLNESTKADEFISNEIYFPTGLFTIPRGGKSSVGMTAPPVSSGDLIILDSSNVINPEKIAPKRSINKYFYNGILVRYAHDIIGDRFLRNKLDVSSDSVARIQNVGNRSMVIESKGLRKEEGINEKIESISLRLLNRYQFGATSINLSVNLAVGFNIDVGDVLLFDATELKVYSEESGDRDSFMKMMEVKDKKHNIFTGVIELELVDTALLADARYGTIAPSSLVGSGSTTTSIVLKQSYGNTGIERRKWEKYIGQIVSFANDDWSFEEEVRLVSFDPSNESKIIVEELSQAPSENWTLGPPRYSGDAKTKRLWKTLHCALQKTVDVVAGISTTKFTVSSSDIGYFYEGAVIYVSNTDFSKIFGNFTVDSISGNDVTVSSAMDEVLDNSFIVTFTTFSSDNGKAYRYF